MSSDHLRRYSFRIFKHSVELLFFPFLIGFFYSRSSSPCGYVRLSKLRRRRFRLIPLPVLLLCTGTYLGPNHISNVLLLGGAIIQSLNVFTHFNESFLYWFALNIVLVKDSRLWFSPILECFIYRSLESIENSSLFDFTPNIHF